MPLPIGTRLGPYELVAKLGAGGMGEVYRARDTKLKRDVAIKVLPETFASDPDRLWRFSREAMTLAALNHPNIAHIHGLEESDHLHALVMELVEGDDLSKVIARGPRPLAETVAIARQIADALEAAHDQGIIHRDLKPANVKVRPDGLVKVLDFGLAKAAAPESGPASDPDNSPTLTARMTEMGTIVGTAVYMAPEQARGKTVDRRADIWAFGVVLYEMLSGTRPFKGADVATTLASVIKDDVDWRTLPSDLPASVRRLLRRCLEKDPRKRLSAIGDARLELDDLDSAASGTTTAPHTASRSTPWLWSAVAATLITAGVAAVLWPKSGASLTTGGVMRSSLLPPLGIEMYPDSTGVTISPDGTMVAFLVGGVTRSGTQLWVRSLDSTTSHRLDDADGATLPFWSPDSHRIGFFSDGKLKTTAPAGGRAEVVCDAASARGGAWSPSNVIVFAPSGAGPLLRVPATGGTPTAATTLDASRKEGGHRFPIFLPDGDHFLFVTLPGKSGRFDVFASSLTDPSRTFVGSLESAPVYAAPGWLLYGRQGVLNAQRFDANTRTISGDPIPLADQPTSILDPTVNFTAGPVTSISSAGTLAYFSSSSTNTVATWYDAGGHSTGTLDLPPGHYETVRISPDGSRAIFGRSTTPSDSALWLADLRRGSAVPFVSERGRNDTPVWSPDGRQVVFISDREGTQAIYVKTVDDNSAGRLLARTSFPFNAPNDWSPDGKRIVITVLNPQAAEDVWVLPASGGDLVPYTRGAARFYGGPLSPDGHWLAYLSDETGRFELFVQPFPELGHRVQISQQGASLIWWTRDGRQLFYLAADLHSMWRVDVTPGATFGVETPKQVGTFAASILAMDATPDRLRFLAVSPEPRGVGSATIVQNWRAAVDKTK